MKLVISDAHFDVKAAITKVFNATWQRCRMHFMRNALAYANMGQRQMVLALINTAFLRTMPSIPRTAGAAEAERGLDTELLDHACLLCSEPTAEHGHRRLAAEYLREALEPALRITIIHL